VLRSTQLAALAALLLASASPPRASAAGGDEGSAAPLSAPEAASPPVAQPPPPPPVERVVDVPTRPGVTERLLIVAPEGPPKAAVILFAGGHGGLQLTPEGRFGWGAGNFLVRSRRLFAEHGLLAVVIDAPSDRQREPFLQGFRMSREHAADVGAVVAWLRREAQVPVWLVGTSRGTQSAAAVAVELSGGREAPDGLVLTSSILRDRSERPVPDEHLDRLFLPVLVVHHRADGCPACPYGDLPRLERQIRNTPRHQVIAFDGGEDEGDPCGAKAHHGYNGIEPEVVEAIARFVLAP